MAFSDYERFKWQVLYQSADYFGLDSPWYWARRIAPEDVAAQGELVSRATLELFDAGLIFCAYAARDDAYNMTFDEFVAVERNALEVELARDLEYIEPEDRLFWLLPTDTGLQLLKTLPPEARLGYDDQVAWETFAREHPEWLEARDSWLREWDAWQKTMEGDPPQPPPNWR